MEVTKRRPLFTSLVAFVILSISLWSGYCSAADHVTSFQQSVSDVESESHSDQGSFLRLLRKRRDAVPDDVTTTESEKYDQRCLNQKEKFSELRNSIKAGQRLEETYTFLNESKFNLALAWAGVDDDGTLLILTTDRQHMMAAVSTLWRSTDNGRSWKNWNDHVDNNIFRQSDGLQRNPHNPKKVYLIGYEHFLYVTEDGGEKWHKSDLVHDDEGQKLTAIDEQLEFHPESDYEDYVMVTSNDRKLYVTYDNFQSKMEESIKSDVHIVKWGTKEQGKAKSIFATTGEYKNPLLSTGPALLDLERYDSERKIWEKIQSKVSMFDVQGKFIYASVYKSDKPKNEEDEKLMMISSDGGESWNEAQLPTLIGDRFYSVLDMSEGLIFMHVDNPGDTGHGVLYTSWENGIVYSESLPNHLFPNYNTVHDFYKIKSIRGVYLASQMSYDKSIHTVITYNLGGEWKNVSRPIGVPCENSEEEGCFLQIHNAYSIHRGIKARLPHSLDKAYGLVLVHGHVASNLQTTDPDVYMSTDGGYNFRMVLKGPHAYEIADSGGLVVAVPLNDPYPKTIKFSTDEGNCWHVYKFTDQEIKFTGLLTEPGGKSLTISVWGYLKDTKKWTLNVIDFGKVVTKHCVDSDYEPWTPHTGMSMKSVHDGCLLGCKEVFSKIKQDSWCKNGYNKHMVTLKETCTCTEEDYECDFGFYRPTGSTTCRRQPDIKAEELDICENGKLIKLETVGYRLVPGTKCKPGKFQPKSLTITEEGICGEGSKAPIAGDMEPVDEGMATTKVVVVSIVMVMLVVMVIVGGFFGYKLVLLRRHKVVYRYSMLNQSDNRDDEFENALVSHDTLYKESSDEEVEQENRSPQHQPSKWLPGEAKPKLKSYHDDSDDDMLN